MWDLTAEAASKYYVLDWDVGKTTIPPSRDDVQLTSPHSVTLAPVREANKCFHSIGGSSAHCSCYHQSC